MRVPKTLYAIIPKVSIGAENKGYTFPASNGRDVVTAYEELSKAKEDARPEDTIVVVDTVGYDTQLNYSNNNIWFLPSNTKYRITGKKGKVINAEMVLPRKRVEPKSLSFNDRLFDAYTRHQVTLMQYADSLSFKYQQSLSRSGDRIEARILKTLEGFEGVSNQRDANKVETLIAGVLAIRSDALNTLEAEYFNDIADLSTEEQSWWMGIVSLLAPYALEGLLNKFTKKQIITAVLTTRLLGSDVKDYVKKVKQEDLRQIESAIRAGTALGESPQEIVKRLAGTPALNGSDGTFAQTDRSFSTVNRTIVNHAGNVVRDTLTVANSSLFDKEVFVATLDGRTTPLCRSLDGNLYDVGKGAKPPLHVGCRSKRVPLFKVMAGGKYKLKPEYETEYKEEWERSNKDKTYAEFRKDRLFQDVGSEAPNITYTQWLERQSSAYQDEILGKTRAKLFRSGELDLDKFVNPNGGYHSLKDLAVKERQAFIDAGLDPDKYL